MYDNRWSCVGLVPVESIEVPTFGSQNMIKQAKPENKGFLLIAPSRVSYLMKEKIRRYLREWKRTLNDVGTLLHAMIFKRY